jgi:hypothetical protein
MTVFTLQRDPHGHLRLTLDDGTVHEDVHPVRAFPLSDPKSALSLLGADGRECLWVADPTTLPAEALQLIEEELAARNFMPEILALLDVSTFATPSDWTVQTDRGQRVLVLNAEEDIRRLGDGRLLVTDRHGVPHIISRPAALDRRSRRLLERFL